MAVLQPYYYLAYAIRRLLGSDGKTKDFREWRAVMLLLLVEVQLVMALIYVFARTVFQDGTSVGWGYGIGVPIVIATYLILGNRRRYVEYTRTFDAWSGRKRMMADIAAWAFGAIALFAPILVKTFAH
jgi:hypothetical protein